jgi:two-component system, OmpR family, response regulator MprA
VVTTILVVDDEPLIRDVLVDLLRDEGYAVVTADDGLSALEVVREEAPALVLMDVMMPRMNGCAAFRAMRGHLQGDGLPIVLMSAMAEPADLDPEIAAFLRKPVDLEDLLALVARLLMDG